LADELGTGSRMQKNIAKVDVKSFRAVRKLISSLAQPTLGPLKEDKKG
jgi:hypothetical protein